MRKVFLLLALALAFGGQTAEAQEPMKFFVTSAAGPDASGPRGIRAADQHCELLGYNAGYGEFQWRAFLDVPAAEGRSAEKAIERIGSGPWHNIQGVRIAGTTEELMGQGHNVTRETALDDKGGAPYARAGAADPFEALRTSKPDANGLYFCFAH